MVQYAKGTNPVSPGVMVVYEDGAVVNAEPEMRVTDEVMHEWWQLGIIAVECEHTKDPKYDGVYDPWWCPSAVLTIKGPNSRVVYKRDMTTSSAIENITGWRWPD